MKACRGRGDASFGFGVDGLVPDFVGGGGSAVDVRWQRKLAETGDHLVVGSADEPYEAIAVGEDLDGFDKYVIAQCDALAWLEADSDRRKGEFVLILSGADRPKEAELSEQARHTLQLLMHELPLKQAVKLAAEISGESKNRLYSLALSLQPHPGS